MNWSELKYLSTGERFRRRGFNNIEFKHDLTSRPGFATGNNKITPVSTCYGINKTGRHSTKRILRWFISLYRIINSIIWKTQHAVGHTKIFRIFYQAIQANFGGVSWNRPQPIRLKFVRDSWRRSISHIIRHCS
jgi:hypothetical protein